MLFHRSGTFTRCVSTFMGVELLQIKGRLVFFQTGLKIMPTDDELLLCYNKGCGKSFDPKQNEPGRLASFAF